MLSDIRNVAIVALLVFSLTLVIGLKIERAERKAAEAQLETLKAEAQAYDKRSKDIADETSNGYQALVEQIKDKDIALNAARARFGSCHASRGAPALRLPAQHGSGEADSATSVDGAVEESVAVSNEFINDCALDAGRLDAWRSWAVKNDLPVSKD